MVLQSFDQDIINLIPDDITMASPLDLSQYQIQTWQLVYYDQHHKNEGLRMEVTFKRRLASELLTTYLPSFFLLGICYATTYFKKFYFEAAVTVNLTAMLVSTTLFIRKVFDKQGEILLIFTSSVLWTSFHLFHICV